MMTGWYTDTDNNQYYLSPISDNTMGHMVTGWYWIPGADGKSDAIILIQFQMERKALYSVEKTRQTDTW